MLRRSIDTKQGLVNGAIGTVLSITKERVQVKFDHITEPNKVESTESIHSNEKFLCVQRTVSTHIGIWCDHSLVLRVVLGLCHSRFV